MKIKLTLLMLAVFLGSCKSKTENAKSEQSNQEPKPIIAYKLPKEVKRIAQFADIAVTDSTDVNSFLNFKAIDTTGTVMEISMDEALSLYKTVMESEMPSILPIFDFKDTQNCMLIVSERGFGGKIWGKLLVDKTTSELLKVEFDHKAESDEYGADGITLPSFEDQFIGTKINWRGNTFGLEQSGKTLTEGDTMIDGISGATVTSQGVLKMMNEGLQKYGGYLDLGQKNLD